MLELRFVDAENRDFHNLTAALDEYYFMLVGEVEKRYAKYNLPHLFDCRIVAYEDGKPAGCGAWKKIDEGDIRGQAHLHRAGVPPKGRGKRGHCGSRAGCGKVRLHQGHPRDRPHDRGFGGAVHQARLSRHSVLRQSGGRGKLSVL